MEKLKEVFKTIKEFVGSTEVWSFFTEHWIYLVVGIAVILVLIVFVYSLVKTRKKKRSSDRIKFIINTENLLEKESEIHIKKQAIFGRADIADVVIYDNKMSRCHFIIKRKKKTFWIDDLNSTNGTYLNGIKITEPRQIENRDRIFAGLSTITVISQESQLCQRKKQKRKGKKK